MNTFVGPARRGAAARSEVGLLANPRAFQCGTFSSTAAWLSDERLPVVCSGSRGRLPSRGLSLAKTRSEGSRPNSCSIGAIGHGPQERQRTKNRSGAQRDGSLVRGSRARAGIAYPSLRRKAERPWLRSATDVAVVESADLRHCHDIAALGWLDRAWF